MNRSAAGSEAGREVLGAGGPGIAGWRGVAGRYLRFCVVGGSGVVVDMGVLYLMTHPERLGWDLTWSKVVAAEVAVLNNFVWNEWWTFRDMTRARRGTAARLGRLARFNLICLLGIGLSAGLLNAQVRLLGMNVYVANLVAIVLVSVWNFWLNLKLGWCGEARTG